MRLFFIISLMLSAVSYAHSQTTSLKTPSEFLGYEPGEAFTRHHRVLEYFRHVDEALPTVRLIPYGETYERRQLLVAVIASEENMARLQQIREDNLRRTGLLPGSPSTKVGIVWMSYNVHGNESNSTETSMRTLYELANPANSTSQAWLKNTVVIIDPCINPDGRDRYANFYNQYGNFPANPDPQSREHREPWPGGRPNHYLFDLNRDWAWLTQKESSARISIYNQWMPQVHVDFHEQGYNSPYYFAPAAEPYHDVITPWQREFQQTIGKNHAKYFDKEGWLYFTKERFDLYYPSYGDTYPTYSGAIGMTYEKAGGGSAGLVVDLAEGDSLTLRDRIEHHFTTGMSTVEVSSQNMDRLLDEFTRYFRDNLNNPSATYKTYIVKGNNNPDKLASLSRWLYAHGIEHGHPAGQKASKGFDFSTRTSGPVNIESSDLIFHVYQTKGRFVTAVFEPQGRLADSLTYDITAWNPIYGAGLKAYALQERINPAQPFRAEVPAALTATEKPYAYICRYQSLADASFLAALLNQGIRVRTAMRSFTNGGQSYEPGTLVITRNHNQQFSGFDATVKKLAAVHGRSLQALKTGYAEAGPDAGSSDFVFVKAPRIALLGGDQTSSQNHGQAWHFFEQTVKYPISVIGTDYFRTIDLWKYDVLVVPEGNYRLFDDEMLTTISRWVSDGGRLILIGNAINPFAGKKDFQIKAAEKAEDEKSDQLVAFSDRERLALSSSLFGAIYKITMDKSHPLSFGIGDTYYSLKTSGLHFPYLNKGNNVGTIRGKAAPIQGFSGKRINRQLENTLVFGSEEKGSGRVIYLADNPLFRSFWENGKMLFANAVFLGGASF